jgi:predicted transcriptional regulator
MTETLSIRIDSEIRKRLELLAKQSKRSKSFLAAEAIAAYVESESWQLGEIKAAIEEIDGGMGIPHEQVSEWLSSWGRKNERKAPE